MAAAFVMPATIAGFRATRGIVKHPITSDAWQIIFAVIGTIAVGIIAFVQVAGLAAAPAPSGRALVRA